METADLSLRSTDGRLRRLIELLEEGTSVTLNDVSHFIGYSSSRIQHLIKEEYGLSFGEIRTRIRIDQAVRLLSETSFSVKEVSARVGYLHPSSFCREFRRRTGQTPAAWRKQQVRLTNSGLC